MKTIVMFPGQGSQHTGMGAELFELFEEETTQASATLGYDVKDLCLNETNNAKLNETRYTQPLLFLVNALSEMHRLREGGKTSDLYIGHSLGEYNALHASGVFSLMTGLNLVAARGVAMDAVGLENKAASAGGMLAVLGLTEDKIDAVIAEKNYNESVFVANLNAPGQIILSGLRANLEEITATLTEAGARKCVPLNVSGAFHSPLMNRAGETMSGVLAETELAPLGVPVIANLTAAPYSNDPNEIRKTLTQQITHKVRWQETMQTLLKTESEAEFLEVGPGKVLSGLLRRNR